MSANLVDCFLLLKNCFCCFLTDISDETALVPLPEGENERLSPEPTYNFLSECFYMTHFAIKLGFHVVHERFLKLNQELARIQRAYQDIVRAGQEGSEIGVKIKDLMEKSQFIMYSCFIDSFT